MPALRIEQTTLNRLKQDVSLLADREPDHPVLDVGVAKPHGLVFDAATVHPHTAASARHKKFSTRINLLAVLQCGICLCS